MKFAKYSALAMIAFGIVGCDSNDNDDVVPPVATPTFNLQVLHASADAPAVNVVFGGDDLLSNVDYKSGSGQARINSGTYSVQVDGILPSGPATVIGPVDVDFAADTIYTIVAVGKVADQTLEPVVLSQPRAEPATGNARAFVLHGAPDAPAVDVFVTVPGADLTITDKLGTFSYKETLGPVEVPAGDYQIRVTPENTPTTELYDSGTLTLNAGDDLVLTAVPGSAFNPVSLIALTGGGSAELTTVGTAAGLRVIHASPDAPNVDVIANDALTLVSDLPFPAATGFLSVAPDTYNVKVADTSNTSAVVIDADLTLDAGIWYDVLAVGTINPLTIEPVVATDDYRRIATAAKVRLIHASPTAQDVDIYVTAPGVSIDEVEPTLAAVPFKANTGFLELDAGPYVITITPTGTKSPAIGPLEITVDTGGIYTAIARDAVGGGGPLSVILLDDFLL